MVTPAPKRRAVCIAKSGFKLVAKASWAAGRSWWFTAGGDEGVTVEVWVAAGLVVESTVGVVSAGAWGAVRAASREVVASWLKFVFREAGVVTG
jgi:hypothetical protein